MRYRLHAAVLLAVSGVVLAACGGTTSKPGASGESGAALVSANAVAYAAVDSDLSSKQWTQVDDLLKKFPAHDEWIRELKQSLKQDHPPLDYEQDVKGALGPEVDVAAVIPQGGRPAFAVLTKPESMAKAKELVRKENAASDSQKAVTREVDGWLAVSSSQQMLDEVLKGSDGSLAEAATFKAAIASLPADALAKAYVDGQRLAHALPSFLGGGAQTAAVGTNPLAPLGLDKLDWVGAAVDANGDGIRFQAGVKGGGTGGLVQGGAPYSSQLISGVPADALAFVTFHGSTKSSPLDQLRRNPQYGAAIRAVERQLGMSLDSVVSLFANEVALYVRRGPGLPEFSLVLEAPDTEAALATIDRVAARAAAMLHSRVQTEQDGGLTVKSLAVSKVTVRWAGFDGRVLLTTGPTGISDYRSTGDKLAGSSAYKSALDAAGAPDKTSGLVYVDLHDADQLIQSYLGLSGGKIPPDVEANLKPLQSFVAYNTTDGDLEKATAFLQIK